MCKVQPRESAAGINETCHSNGQVVQVIRTAHGKSRMCTTVLSHNS